MRVSFSGCRVLRRACGENCTIRPCLQWIQSPESQANATIFLVKYYGRTGLENLLNVGPSHLRPAIFRSLLYEACGRIVNPIYGSAGLLLTGNWNLCQAVVEVILSGASIVQVSPELMVNTVSPLLKAGNIMHVFKEEASKSSLDLHEVKSQTKFKRVTTSGAKLQVEAEPCMDEAAAHVICSWLNNKEMISASTSHESVLSHESDKGESGGESTSAEPMEASLTTEEQGRTGGGHVELEQMLGLEPIVKE